MRQIGDDNVRQSKTNMRVFQNGKTHKAKKISAAREMSSDGPVVAQPIQWLPMRSARLLVVLARTLEDLASVMLSHRARPAQC